MEVKPEEGCTWPTSSLLGSTTPMNIYFRRHFKLPMLKGIEMVIIVMQLYFMFRYILYFKNIFTK